MCHSPRWCPECSCQWYSPFNPSNCARARIHKVRCEQPPSKASPEGPDDNVPTQHCDDCFAHMLILAFPEPEEPPTVEVTEALGAASLTATSSMSQSLPSFPFNHQPSFAEERNSSIQDPGTTRMQTASQGILPLQEQARGSLIRRLLGKDQNHRPQFSRGRPCIEIQQSPAKLAERDPSRAVKYRKLKKLPETWAIASPLTYETEKDYVARQQENGRHDIIEMIAEYVEFRNFPDNEDFLPHDEDFRRSRERDRQRADSRSDPIILAADMRRKQWISNHWQVEQNEDPSVTPWLPASMAKYSPVPISLIHEKMKMYEKWRELKQCSKEASVDRYDTARDSDPESEVPLPYESWDTYRTRLCGPKPWSLYEELWARAVYEAWSLHYPEFVG